MGVDTLTALLQVKLNVDDDCYKVKPSSDLIKSAKSATTRLNWLLLEYSITDSTTMLLA